MDTSASCSDSIPCCPQALWDVLRWGKGMSIPPCNQILDNGKIRVGLDFDLGGSIGYLATSDRPTRNFINSVDQGREVQMSFYADPIPYNPNGACSDLFRGDWPWNPIGAGDVTGKTSEILEFDPPHSSTENTTNDQMRIVTRPLQWACDNVPCECTFNKTLQTIPGVAAVKVTATLHNNRTDDYNEERQLDQELPAVYTNGILYRLVTYNGSLPFQGQPLTEFDASFDNDRPFPWIPGRFSATEHWAAFVDGHDFGVGVINLEESIFLGGFFQPCKKGFGGPKDGQAGYIAPVSQHALPRNITFTYEYYLVLGSIQEIRSFATLVHEQKLQAQSGREDDDEDPSPASSLADSLSQPVSPWLRPKLLTILERDANNKQ